MVGHWQAAAVRPADLLRDKPLAGHLVELADGYEWLSPMARSHAEESARIVWRHALPRGVALNPFEKDQEQRKWQPGPVLPRYRRLWDLGLAWWDVRMAAGTDARFDFNGLYAAAAECLSANYRLGPDEITLLGLFDSDSAESILDALIDLPGLAALSAELQKKTAALAQAQVSPPSAT